jgi:biofilm PGA synthesis N-glycosyltransferase PgaC
MYFLRFIFWISCFFVFYNYAGYAILVYFINRLKRRPRNQSEQADSDLPTVTFIVAAYNEEYCIKEKITNSLEQDYPKDKIHFLFVTDGSTDDTMDIIRQFPSIELLHSPERKGKSAALNRAVNTATQEILVISDANTILNAAATRNIVRHYQDEKTGGVAGEKKVLTAPAGSNEVGDGEGLYWKYESSLKKLDSDFYSVVGAAGELFSLRRNLYEAIPHEAILDDFVLSLRVAQKGFRIHYEPDAYAMELPSFSLKDEQKRKVRIAAGGFQSIGMLAPLLAFWKTPRLSFLYISHRVLRWTLSPLCMLLAFLSNAILCLTTDSWLFKALFIAQVGFYLVGSLAALSPSIQKGSKIAKLAYYFIFMNVSVVWGFFRFIRRRQASTWEKARRVETDLV